MAVVISASEFRLLQLNKARPSLEKLHPVIFRDGGPNLRGLIEIHGDPGSGKSLLLWQIMAHCLPEHHNGGKYCDILFLNLSQKFDTRKFMVYLEHVISTANPTITKSKLAEAVQNCVDSVTVLNCFDASDLELAFHQAGCLLDQNQNFSLVVVDSLCNFYILEAQFKRLKMSSYYLSLVGKLREICQKWSISVAYTVEQSFLRTTNPMFWPAVEYRLHMWMTEDGLRCLSNEPVFIDKNGVHFDMLDEDATEAKKMKMN